MLILLFYLLDIYLPLADVLSFYELKFNAIFFCRFNDCLILYNCFYDMSKFLEASLSFSSSLLQYLIEGVLFPSKYRVPDFSVLCFALLEPIYGIPLNAPQSLSSVRYGSVFYKLYPLFDNFKCWQTID